MTTKTPPMHLQLVDSDPMTRSERALRVRATPQANDDDLIARAATTALSGWTPRVSQRPQRRALTTFAVAAVLLLVAVTTSYATLRVLRSQPQASAPRQAPHVNALPVAAAPEVVPVEAPPTPQLEVPVGAGPEPKPMASSGLDANALLERAGLARQRGQLGQAQRLYERLQAVHPQSTQALTSRVSLGRMLLAQPRQTARALAQFNAYLAAGPQGPLHEQALAGKAQALEAMGKPNAAAGAWKDLMRLYPNSLYATHARQRAGR